MSVAETTDPVFTLGNRLWLSRERAGMKQADIAPLLGVSRALVARWERDQSDPRVRQVEKWAEITGVRVQWLLGHVSTSAYKSDEYREGEESVPLLASVPSPRRRASDPPAFIQSPLVAAF